MNKGQRIVILGAGESGVGAALLARREGCEVFVSDRGAIAAAFKQELIDNDIPYEEGQHTEERIFSADEVIKSPGIPDRVPLIQKLESKGIPVISEIEFAGRYTDAFLVGITGTNGKTTTTRLTYHLLHTAGLDVGVGGNIGVSFARLLTRPRRRCYVLELSSFQLDGIRDFRPQLAMLLNITPDHLDRYAYRMENYVASKFRITRNQKPDDWFLYNAENEAITGYLRQHEVIARRAPIDSSMIVDQQLRVAGETYELANTALRGRHNALNALFAVRTARLLVADPDAIQRGLETIVPVAHRLEPVGVVDGVTFLNDSKATNVDAVFYALEAMRGPTVWIAGGQDKGNEYEPLLPLVRRCVKAIVCLGKDNRKIIEAFRRATPVIEETNTAESAVRIARRLAEPGDTVLLSPACASFDLFRNYEDRGDQFRQAVERLIKEYESAGKK